MSIEDANRRVLDYDPCRYGASRVFFRGPKKSLNGRYVAFLGGTETYGKFIEHPFPALVEAQLGLPCVNFGCVNGGLDVFLNDPDVLAITAKAEVTVLQILGAQNMSNRFYRVHPRRNDRFLTASRLMQSIYHEVDFSEFNFTRHMLKGVSEGAKERFSFVREELRAAWNARMVTLLGQIPGRKLLLWFADQPPPAQLPKASMGRDPMFVDANMVERLRQKVDGVTQVNLSKKALMSGTYGMRFSELDRPAAQSMLGPLAHQEAADALAQDLRPLLIKAEAEAEKRAR